MINFELNMVLMIRLIFLLCFASSVFKSIVDLGNGILLETSKSECINADTDDELINAKCTFGQFILPKKHSRSLPFCALNTSLYLDFYGIKHKEPPEALLQ